MNPMAYRPLRSAGRLGERRQGGGGGGQKEEKEEKGKQKWRKRRKKRRRRGGGRMVYVKEYSTVDIRTPQNVQGQLFKRLD